MSRLGVQISRDGTSIDDYRQQLKALTSGNRHSRKTAPLLKMQLILTTCEIVAIIRPIFISGNMFSEAMFSEVHGVFHC
jgi:hypothetical protein